MIEVNKNEKINGRSIHELVDGNVKNYSVWINRRIDSLTEGVDYFRKKLPSTGGRPRIDYYFNYTGMIKLLQKEAIYNERAYSILAKVDTLRISRDEIMFHRSLKDVFGDVFLTQKHLLNFKVDFMLDDLIIEYDECHHKGTQEKDKIREEAIRDYIIKSRSMFFGSKYFPDSITFIRVKAGEEMEGIGRIMRYFIEKEIIILDCKGNYHHRESWVEREKKELIKEAENGLINFPYCGCENINELKDAIKNL